MASHEQQLGGSPSRTSQLLVQMMSEMASRLESIQADQAAEKEATRLQIRHLQENLANIRVGQATLLSTVPESSPFPLSRPPSLSQKRKATLPDPPRFSG